MKHCKLTILDEVNFKIEGLSIETRRKIANKYKFALPNARHTPACKLGRWDGAVSFFGIGGSGYNKHLGEILPIIENDRYDIEFEDRRVPDLFEFTEIKEDFHKGISWPTGHPDAGKPVILRDYQLSAINAFLTNTQCLQEISTGAGKTIITATLSKLCEQYGRTIVIVPNKSLVLQTEEDYVLCGLDVGVYYGDRKEFGKKHTICTWQSLDSIQREYKNDTSKMSVKDFANDVVAVIVDEVHSAKATVLKDLLTKDFSNCQIRWGLTGTIPKEPMYFESLRISIGEVINKVSAHDLQQKGVLSKCHVNILQILDTKEFKTYQEELKFLISDKTRIDWMVQTIKNISSTGNTLVLIDRIATGDLIMEQIPEATFISGGTKVKDRSDHYKAIHSADNQITVATYGVAAVGINIPRIFNLVLIEPGKSFVRVIQSIGRGIRKAEDKSEVMIWDIASSCKFSKRHLATRKKYYNEAKYPHTITKVDI